MYSDRFNESDVSSCEGFQSISACVHVTAGEACTVDNFITLEYILNTTRDKQIVVVASGNDQSGKCGAGRVSTATPLMEFQDASPPSQLTQRVKRTKQLMILCGSLELLLYMAGSNASRRIDHPHSTSRRWDETRRPADTTHSRLLCNG